MSEIMVGASVGPHERNARCEAHGCHPAAVIDPESGDVNRLIHILGTAARGSCGRFRAALREFANPTPPQPDEPQGLGAVVEDAKGRRYTRTGVHGDDSTWVREADGCEFSWLALPLPVRVLSEGVTDASA